MRSGGNPKKKDPRVTLGAQGFALGKRIGAGEFGEVYIATYGGTDPSILALLNKDGELVVKIPKKPVYKAKPNMTDAERIKAERNFEIRVEAAAKTVMNEYNIISGGLGAISLGPNADFIPKVHAEAIGGVDGDIFIYNELVNGVNLETYLRQLGKDELIHSMSLAPQIENDADLSSGYLVVDSDDENVGYGVEPDVDSNDEKVGYMEERDIGSGDENVGYAVEPDEDDVDEDFALGNDQQIPDQSNNPPENLYGAPVKNHDTTKKLTTILNALGPLLEKLNLLGFAHNDFSCRNVMVMTNPDGSIKGLKLLDFGLTLKLDKDGNCIDNPNIGVCPRTLYGRLDNRWDRSVVTEGMCLQYAKIEALAIFMGYLALPEAGSDNNQDIKNVFADIHQKWLACKNGTITNQHDNAERLENSVRNLDAAAANLEIDDGVQQTRDPRGVIVEHLIGEMREELIKVPVLDQNRFNAYAAPAEMAAASAAADVVQPKPALSVNAAMHQAIGANKNTGVQMKPVEGLDENKKVSDNVSSSQAQVAVKGKDKEEETQVLGAGRRK